MIDLDNDFDAGMLTIGQLITDALERREFELRYAENSGTTVEELHENGLRAERCDCGSDDCQGWTM